MAKPNLELETISIVDLLEALETIKVTPERLKKNRTHMNDNNGGLIEY